MTIHSLKRGVYATSVTLILCLFQNCAGGFESNHPPANQIQDGTVGSSSLAPPSNNPVVIPMTPTPTPPSAPSVGGASVPSACRRESENYLRVVNVSGATQLQTALDRAKAGDVIILASGLYSGQFTANTSGTSVAPISLCGLGNSILDGGSNATLSNPG